MNETIQYLTNKVYVKERDLQFEASQYLIFFAGLNSCENPAELGETFHIEMQRFKRKLYVEIT